MENTKENLKINKNVTEEEFNELLEIFKDTIGITDEENYYVDDHIDDYLDEDSDQDEDYDDEDEDEDEEDEYDYFEKIEKYQEAKIIVWEDFHCDVVGKNMEELIGWLQEEYLDGMEYINCITLQQGEIEEEGYVYRFMVDGKIRDVTIVLENYVYEPYKDMSGREYFRQELEIKRILLDGEELEEETEED